MTTPHEIHTVTHTLKVTEMICPECDEIIVDALTALEGIKEVKSDWRKSLVTVTYDLHKARIQDVEKLLIEIGYAPDPGFFHRKKRDWLHFTEQNEVDNLKHVAHCCSRPPVMA